MWVLGSGFWDLFLDSIVAVNLGGGAVGVDVAVINIPGILATNDFATADSFLTFTDCVLPLHNFVVPAVPPGFQSLSLHRLILIVGRPDAVVLCFAVLVRTRTGVLERFG
jgi:hypothetical protein